jgi:hypothetical protein
VRVVLALISFVAIGVFVSSDARGLEIQVAPQNLVVSSGGDNVTLHTDHYDYPPEGVLPELVITPQDGEAQVVTVTAAFLDDCNYYVVRCSRQAAATAIGEFDGRWTTATVTLTIGEDSASEKINVRK